MNKETLHDIDSICTRLGIETWMKDPDYKEISAHLEKLNKIYTEWVSLN